MRDYIRENRYYDQLWKSEQWGAPELNDDEKCRLNAIISYVFWIIDKKKESQKKCEILDVGCGRGWLTNELEQYGEALGIDPVASSIERASHLFDHLQFLTCATSDLLSQDKGNSFDLIVSSEVIEHIPYPNQDDFLKDIYRLLKAGGYAILTTPRKELWEEFSCRHQSHQPVEDWLSEEELTLKACNVGFKEVSRGRIFVPSQRIGGFSSYFTRRLFFLRHPSLLKMPIISKLKYNASVYQIAVFVKD